MASDWQQWYMHKIDAWQGSATIQTFSDAAYRAFHNLIMAQFQQEDGKLPDSDQELAKHSRAGAQWNRRRNGLPTIREEVMAHFVSDGNGRVLNRVQFSVWEGSKARHLAHVDRTRKAAEAKAAKHGKTPQQPPQNGSLSTGLGEQNETLTGAQQHEVEGEVGSGKQEVGSNNNKTATPTATPVFVLPEWISEETWAAFEKHRKAIRKPLTDQARKNIVAKLIRLEAQGMLAEDVLNESITNGWSGVFTDGKRGTNGNNGNRNQQRTDGNLEALRRATGGRLEGGDHGFSGSAPSIRERGNTQPLLAVPV